MTDGSEQVRAEIVVSGRVQGVFFRDTVKQAALDHGVSGAAANLPDGTVHVVLEGPREEVEAVIAVCRVGPPAASVTDVLVSWSEPAGLTGFTIN